ncbi:hypothetical protein [Cytobacillus purgationiresistens]|uniref:Ca2+/Na+ antiporter n=1 Tax=Cytobacillus purgationiresistens TaxID=863449 RepID=A0ABU0ARP7_9BACI|nr:hypothetical protein [Cytobacillus purgationiresistens]MDQ0273942.1 Ca2+/Na+ antiporter [Cytobacillus purgationiresistens]
MSYVQIGNTSISLTWVAVLVSFFLVIILYRLITHNKVSDWFGNSLFLFFIIWKLSYIPLNFKLFIDTPLSIIYFNGGLKGLIFAVVTVTVYLIYLSKNKAKHIRTEGHIVFLIFYLSFIPFKLILEFKSIGILILLIPLLLMFFLFKYKQNISTTLSNQLYIIFFLIGILMSSLFDNLLSTEFISIMWLGLIIYILGLKKT